MCRLGDDHDQGLTSDDRSYVVTGPGSGFHISQVNYFQIFIEQLQFFFQTNVSPHASPNPRANGKLGGSNFNGGIM